MRSSESGTGDPRSSWRGPVSYTSSSFCGQRSPDSSSIDAAVPSPHGACPCEARSVSVGVDLNQLLSVATAGTSAAVNAGNVDTMDRRLPALHRTSGVCYQSKFDELASMRLPWRSAARLNRLSLAALARSVMTRHRATSGCSDALTVTRREWRAALSEPDTLDGRRCREFPAGPRNGRRAPGRGRSRSAAKRQEGLFQKRPAGQEYLARAQE